jgi:hypothetical protein
VQIGELTIDYPLIGRMSWMVTCKPHLSDSGEVLGVSTASIDITEKVSSLQPEKFLQEM